MFLKEENLFFQKTVLLDLIGVILFFLSISKNSCHHCTYSRCSIFDGKKILTLTMLSDIDRLISKSVEILPVRGVPADWIR